MEALESYSSHLEPSFVRVKLPPTRPDQSIPPTLDVSPSYVDRLDQEFTRVYEEYTRRVDSVKSLAENIIQLWAELGTPQAQTDGAIVKHYRDSPEQLGLHEDDINRLRAKRDKLVDEKNNREIRLQELKEAVEALWDKLGVEEKDRKAFLNANRGCGVRQINEFEDELARLNELKHQNLHLFVEDAREKLQELWDALYMSEDEMLEFTPAFSDVYSDALLEAHEQEIIRLDTLREQRAPMLNMVERHRTLVAERDELAASSQDATRLTMKGQKGEKRDPGKLLREEKMRKRIAKELPKVTADLRKALEKWEDEWGRPFYVHGERYLDILDAEENSRPAPGPRARTPANTSMPSRANSAGPKSAPPVSRSNSNLSSRSTMAPSRAAAKTPTAMSFNSLPTKRGQIPQMSPTKTGSPTRSPTRIPARAPLSNLKHVNTTHDKLQDEMDKPDLLRRNTGPLMPAPLLRAPPPKMRDLVAASEANTAMHYRNSNGSSSRGSGIVRQVEPEDVYDDRPKYYSGEFERPESQRDFRDHPGKASLRHQDDEARYQRFTESYSPAPQQIRQISNTSSGSSSTVITGSENWETYDDASEPEDDDITDTYYAKVRQTKTQTYTLNGSQQGKRPRGIPPALQQQIMVDEDGNRIYSGSEWTDEDGVY